MVQDASGNYVNHGKWTMYDEKGAPSLVANIDTESDRVPGPAGISAAAKIKICSRRCPTSNSKLRS